MSSARLRLGQGGAENELFLEQIQVSWAAYGAVDLAPVPTIRSLARPLGAV
jgi:hypothetical protein